MAREKRLLVGALAAVAAAGAFHAQIQHGKQYRILVCGGKCPLIEEHQDFFRQRD